MNVIYHCLRRVSERITAGANRLSVGALGLVMIVVALAMPAAAQTTLQLENGNILTFSEGSVDMGTASGELRDVSVIEDGEVVLRADYVFIDATGTVAGTDWFINEMIAENAEIPGEQVFIGRIELRDIAAGMLADDAPPANVEDLVTSDTMVRFDNLGFANPEALVSIDSIATLPFDFDTMANGELVMTSSGFEVNGITVLAQDGSAELAPLIDALAARGITDLGMDLRVESLAEVGRDDLRIYYGLETGIGEIAGLGLGMVFQISQDAYQNLVPLLADPDDNGAALLGLSGAVSLEAAEVIIDDAGALDVLFELGAEEEGVSEDEMRMMARMLLASSLQETFPETASRLLPPIEAMIRSGGRLVISAQPGMPVPLSSAIGFVMLPDLAIEQLGIDITHTP